MSSGGFLMKARLIVCLLMVGLVLPGVVCVSAGPPVPARTHIIKAVYYVRHTVLDPSVVMEWYYSPETHTFKWNRGAFVRYDSYTNYFGFGGKWIELYFYYK